MPPLPAVALDHVGLAAHDLRDHVFLAAIAGTEPELVSMPSGVAVGFFGPGETLEIVVPERPGNPIERFLERRGPGLHHLAFRVDEPLAEVVERLRPLGIEPATEIERAADGRPCIFLHPSTTGGILIELVQGPRPS